MSQMESYPVVDAVRQFAQKFVAPRVQELERQDDFPQDIVDGMAEIGLFGMVISDSYGGLDLPLSEYVSVMEELGAVWSAMPSFINSHNTVSKLISCFGTDAQKNKYLSDLASGKKRGAICLTEPSVGSDLKQVRSTAALQADGSILLNGEKIFITNGLRAGITMVLARDKGYGKEDSLSLYIVESGTPGFSVNRLSEKMGFKHVDTAELIYSDVRLSNENLLGGVTGKGLSQVLSMLEAGRLAMAGTAIGMGRNALAIALQYSKERETFGKPISSHQAIQFHLANMATSLTAARALVKEALAHKEIWGRADMLASMAKLFATETTMQITQDAMRILGGYGYVSDFPVERLYREAPLYVLTEGSNEIQRLVIAREMLKEEGIDRLKLN